MYSLSWVSDRGPGRSHFLAGEPPFSLIEYRRWIGSIVGDDVAAPSGTVEPFIGR
jgi:hypothetical protein